MARIRLENGAEIAGAIEAAAVLAPLGVRFEPLPPGADPDARDLLARPLLDAEEKERLLGLLDPAIAHIAGPEGLRTRDLVVLDASLPGLDAALAPFARCHRHDDHETRWIVDGEGTFGFVLPDGGQMAVTIEAGEFIQVPAGVEHWFVLTPLRRIKAVRHFTDKAGWVPRYSGTPVRL